MTETPATGTSPLRRAIGNFGYFSLSFGAIVGSGWVLVLGDWLGRGGPGGAAVGFLAGGISMMGIGLCYAELSARTPMAGGEFLYARACIGPRTAFAVGWFLTLKLIAITAFEGIALGVFIRYLIPSVEGVRVYTLLGAPVTTGSLGIGVAGTLAIGSLNLRGAKSAIAVQNLITATFIGIMSAAVAIAFFRGAVANMTPMFPSTPAVSWPLGALWVFSLSGMFLNGFQAAIHAIEERGRAASLRNSVLSMVLGIGAGAVFYALVLLAAAAAVPWQRLVRADLPAAHAFSASLPGGILGTIVLVAATLSLVKTWNAIVFMASRLIFAQARLGYLPAIFAKVSVPARVPAAAIKAVSLSTIILLPCGRGAVVPIVNMCSMCLAVTYVLSIGILIHLRTRVGSSDQAPAYRVPGGPWIIGAAFSAAVVMAGAAILEPAIRSHGVPLEWMLIAGWGLCGVLAWVFVARKAVLNPIPARVAAAPGRYHSMRKRRERRMDA